jgi:hypothetical protein
MKISYDSSLDLYIIADGLQVMTVTPKQFSAIKTTAELKNEFHKRLDMDKELCYNQNRLRDQEE